MIVGVNELGPLTPAAFSVGDSEGGGVADSDCDGAGLEGDSWVLSEPQADSVAIATTAAPPASSPRRRLKQPELMACPSRGWWSCR